jgi:peptide/nickel transport system substrate-binding protein
MGQINILFCAFALLLLFSSCTRPDSDTKQPLGGETKHTLRVGLTNPIYHIDLHSQSDVNFWQIQSLLFESLLRRSPVSGKLEPRLAHSYVWSKDKKSIRFQLREGLRWSDGEPLSSWDVEFTLRSHGQKEFKSIYFGVYSSRVKKFDVIDDKNFVVHFNQASPANLKAVAVNLLIYPRHHFERSSKTPAEFVPTSGAFQFESFEPGKKLKLLKNTKWPFGSEHLWKGVQFLSYFWFEGQRQLLSAAKQEQIDFFEVASPAQFLKAQNKLAEHSSWVGVKAEGYRLRGRHTLVLNHKNPNLSDIRVRKALLGIARRELLNQKLYKGMLEVARGPWPADHPGGVNLIGEVMPGESQIGAWLRQSGWTDIDQDGVLEKKTADSELSLKLISFDRQFEPFLTLLQDRGKEFGVKIEIERQDFLEAMKSFEAGGGDAVYIYSSWLPFELNLKSWYEAKDDGNPWTNSGHFKDQELSRYIESAEGEYNEAKRLQVLKRAYKRLSELQPDLYLFNDKYKLYFANKRVHRPKDTLPFVLGLETWSL